MEVANEIYRYYVERITYDNRDFKYWTYRPIEQIFVDGIAKCHDIGHYFYNQLRKYNSKRYLAFMSSDDCDEINHTIVTFGCGGKRFVIEGSWGFASGIHGPFENDLDVLRWVTRVYKLTFPGRLPKNPRFKFHEFIELNDSVLNGSKIDEFISAVKGRQIDISHFKLIVNHHSSVYGLIYLDSTKNAFDNYKQFRNIAEDLQMSNSLCSTYMECKSIEKELKMAGVKYITIIEYQLINGNDNLFIDGVQIRCEDGDSELPVLNRCKWILSWYKGSANDRIWRHRQVAKLLIDEFTIFG